MSREGRLSAVVLAAGASSRLGAPKALAEIGGRAALERLVAALREGLGSAPVVVVGRHADEIAAAGLDLGDAEVVTNPRWREGRTASLAAGLAALARRAPAPGTPGTEGPLPDVLVAPVDVPLVAPSTVARIARAWADAGAPPRGWLAPRVPGPGGVHRHGHPVALGRALAAAARALAPSEPLRTVRAGADPLLVRRVDDRPEKTDRHGLDAAVPDLGERPHEPFLVQRRVQGAVGHDALAHLPGEGARHVGLRIGNGEVEDVGAAALAQHQHVGMALGGEKGRLGRGPGDDGVDRPRRAVDEKLALAEQGVQAHPDVVRGQTKAVDHPLDRVVRRGRRLVHPERATRILHQQVGEGSSRIDGKSHPRETFPFEVGRFRVAGRLSGCGGAAPPGA